MVDAPSSLLVQPDAPDWAKRFAARIDGRFVNLFPNAPIRLWSVTSAKLPLASEWPGCIVFVTDKGKIGVSNGSAWRDALGGAL